ncbi:MAG: SRPBCC family protein [Nitriliruptor sp.]
MPRFEEHRTVTASPGTCWQLLTDPDRIPTWLTVASSVRAEGEVGAGQRLVARGGALGVSVKVELEVVAWEPEERFAWRLRDPVRVEATHRLEVVEDGLTRVHVGVEADLGRRVPVRARFAIRVVRGEVARSLDRFAELAEAVRD